MFAGKHLVSLLLIVCFPVPVVAAVSICERIMDGVFVVRDDLGMWRGDLSTSITHQSTAPYQARKILELRGILLRQHIDERGSDRIRTE